MSGRTMARVVLALGAVLSALLTCSLPASAHIDFESSTPADGDVLVAPVSEIIVRFTGEATPAGDEFLVLDPSRGVREPDSVTTVDGTEYVLGFDPPLTGGVVGVRWVVAAPDAHPIDGSFSFMVDAPAPITVPASAVTTTVPSTTATAPTTEPLTAATTSDAATPMTPAGGSASISLEEFLTSEPDLPGQGRQLAGRVAGLLGAVLGVGVLAFLTSAFRGARSEMSVGLMAVAVAGVVTVLGAGLEYSGWLAQSSGSLLGGFAAAPGSGAGLRMLGGVVLAGSAFTAVRAVPNGTRATRALSASVTDQAVGKPSATSGIAERQFRWDGRSAPAALVGAALLVVSFSFDGHTVTEGPRLLHVLVNAVHVTAGAVWVGGVTSFAGLLVMRRRHGVSGRAGSLILRFSGIATVALGAVVAAGGAMAWMVLDSFGELTSTEWGRVLLLKSAAVGLAALGGAYNHFRLRPRLEAAPDDAGTEAELQSYLIAEGIVLVFVVVATAWLVVASAST